MPTGDAKRFDPLQGRPMAQPLNDTPCITPIFQNEQDVKKQGYKKQKTKAEHSREKCEGEDCKGGGHALILGISFAPPPLRYCRAYNRERSSSSIPQSAERVPQADGRRASNVEMWITPNICSVGGVRLLNKKELQQVDDFLTSVTDLARSMLDEVAMFYAELDENKAQQRAESEQRKDRKKRARLRAKSRN